MSNVIQVVAFVVDKHNMTLYKPDGTEHLIKQGDPDLRRILELITPVIQDGGVAEVELTVNSDLGKEYKDFESKSGGLVQFFKVLKTEAERFLGLLGSNTSPVAPLSLGVIPSKNPSIARVEVKRKSSPELEEAKVKQNAAIDEVLANAVPTSSPDFKAPMADSHDEKGNLTSEGTETIVAKIGDTLVPGVEKLSTQFEYAAQSGNSTVGMENFLRRLGAVIKDRGHSVQDLLKFLERGDLPIADDGSFVAYKILRKQGDHFVDCHTRKVPQRIGSYVHMDISLVDPNRRNECSNGLHVARRGYIGSFYGDVCTLIKVNPEDVIAVPEYDANKMRVCGYHIIDLISDADYRSLRGDKAMTDNMAAKIQLGKALAGDHIGITEKVKITEQNGEGVQVTQVTGKSDAKKAVAKHTQGTKRRVAEALKAKEPKEALSDEKVDPTKLAKQVSADKATGGSQRARAAAKMLEEYESAVNPLDKYEAAVQLVALKKTAKVGWEKLGITTLKGAEIVACSTTKPVFQQAEEAPVAPTSARKAVKKNAARDTFKPKGKPPVKPAATTDRQAIMRGLMIKVVKGDKKAAQEALTIKKTSKKSWEALGLTKAEGEKIVKLAAK